MPYNKLIFILTHRSYGLKLALKGKITDVERFQKIILFRAGLIIRKSVIETGIQIFNVHAAKVPEYGGIGSINCALQDEAFDQFACFHRVTDKIDDGEVVDRESYTLSPDEPYYVNEDIAYEAATCLLLRNVELKSS